VEILGLTVDELLREVVDHGEADEREFDVEAGQEGGLGGISF
jgi:hypothetical protein